MWHIDTTVIRLLDGTRVYLHAVIDNFSRRILAWRVAETFAPVNSVAVLLDASRAARPPKSTTPQTNLLSGRQCLKRADPRQLLLEASSPFNARLGFAG